MSFLPIPLTDPRSTGGIELIELPDVEPPPADGVLGAVMAAYRREGFDAGYSRAMNDVLASVVPVAEEFLRQHPAGPPGLRRFVYSFAESVERHLAGKVATATFVEGGLGI